jgi:outer membrane protein assembly factor BamB
MMKLKNTRLFQNFSFWNSFLRFSGKTVFSIGPYVRSPAKANRVLEQPPVKFFLTAFFFFFFSVFSLNAQNNAQNTSGGRATNASKVLPGNMTVSAAPIWEREINDTAPGQPFLQAESIVLAGESGSIKSWYMTGSSLWEFDSRGGAAPWVSRSPEGTSYVGNVLGAFMAVNRVGRELWRLELGKPLSFPAVVGWDGRLFIPVGSTLYCRTASGVALWTVNLNSPIAMAPVLDHAGGVVMFLENNDFLRISQFSAAERLHLDRQPAIIVPLIAGNANSFLLLYQNGEVENIAMNLNASKGSMLSRTRFQRLPALPVAAADYKDHAAVLLNDGRVVLVSADGKFLWTGNTHETTAEKGSGNLASASAALVFDERGIFALTRKGTTAFAADGRRRWIFRHPETAGIPALSAEGLIYAGGKDGNLFTYKVDNQVRNLPRSMYGPDPEGSYGMGNPPPSPWASDDGKYDEQIMTAMYNRIDRDIRAGNVGENEPDYVAYLMEMIGYFLNNPHLSLVRAPIKVPHRIELIRLLARMGSRETIKFLVTIYNRDPEPSIKAACCEAIGLIGVDPKGEAVQAYTFLLSRDNANRDSQILLSATDSIAALCRFSGPPLAADGILLLTQIARFPDFRSDVRKRAQDQLNALRQEGLDKVIQ